MKKFHYILFVVIIGVFVGILYMNQQQNGKTVNATQTPTIPPDASTMKFNIAQQPEKPQQQAQKQVQGQQQQPQAAGPEPTFGVEEGIKASYSATIKTSKGDIEVMLFGKDAPKTVKNFIDKSKSKFYNNLTFHRVEDWVVQGGDPKGNGTGGGLMQTELNTQKFVPGSLGMARGADIRVSNDSQFFITKTDANWLDQQYINFGIVTSGMDVVNNMKIGDKIISITVKE
jgi:peptidyl-prolyl cis-trans isomerase B (cyclophilin B)